MDTTSWHSLTVDDTLRQLSTRMQGLADGEAAERLARFGYNEIKRRKPISPFSLLVKQFGNFFVVVLLFAAALAYAVSFLPGEEGRRLTAFFVLGIIALSIALSFFQEFRAQKELEALDKLLVSKAVVIRAGARRQIDAAQVVPGDVLALSQGQKVPADARLVEAYGLRADEAALTGESVGVDKSPQPDAPLAEMLRVAQGAGVDVEQVRAAYPIINEIPFSSERKMMTTVHRRNGGAVTYTKGAPGIVLAHCTSCWHDGRYVPLEDTHCQVAFEAVEKLQSEGMYVLAGSSLTGVLMTRWILKLVPLWEQ